MQEHHPHLSAGFASSHHAADVFIWLQGWRGSSGVEEGAGHQCGARAPPKLPWKYNPLKIVTFTLLQAGHH